MARHRARGPGRARRDPGPRRQRLLERVPGRALPAQLEGGGHLRGHEPAPHADPGRLRARLSRGPARSAASRGRRRAGSAPTGARDRPRFRARKARDVTRPSSPRRSWPAMAPRAGAVLAARRAPATGRRPTRSGQLRPAPARRCGRWTRGAANLPARRAADAVHRRCARRSREPLPPRLGRSRGSPQRRAASRPSASC